ncbi:MAG: hypothetical protein ACYC0C_04850 [Devosia sp.]
MAIIVPLALTFSFVGENLGGDFTLFTEVGSIKKEEPNIGAIIALFASLCVPALTVAFLLTIVVFSVGRRR